MSKNERYADQFKAEAGPLTISGKLFYGHAAVCSMAPDCTVMLVGPSVEELHRAWKLLVPALPLDVSRVQRVVVGAADNVVRKS